MRYRSLAAALAAALIAGAMPAHAQQQAPESYTVTIPAAHIPVIAKALGALPYSEVARVIEALDRQIQRQQQPQPKLPVPDKPPAADPQQ